MMAAVFFLQIEFLQCSPRHGTEWQTSSRISSVKPTRKGVKESWHHLGLQRWVWQWIPLDHFQREPFRFSGHEWRLECESGTPKHYRRHLAWLVFCGVLWIGLIVATMRFPVALLAVLLLGDVAAVPNYLKDDTASSVHERKPLGPVTLAPF